MNPHLFRLVPLILLVLQGSFACFAQSASGSVVQREFEVSWIQDASLAPVGQWSVGDGYWPDELPWAVYEIEFPVDWHAAVELVSSEQWVFMEAESLTNRQIELAQNQRIRTGWNVMSNRGLAQWMGPLIRWNDSDGQFERLVNLAGVFGNLEITENVIATDEINNRTRNWPEVSKLAEGQIIRLSIPQDGLYRIDRDWMVQAGFDPDTLNPNRLQLYGNGGRMLPMANATSRPLGLQTVAMKFQGDSDDAWEEGETFLFWGLGADEIQWNPGSNEWTHQRHAYENQGWYFLAIDREESLGRLQTQPMLAEPMDTLIDRYTNVQFHEQELQSPNRSGREWFGESFGAITSRSFNFSTPFATESTAKLKMRVAAQSMGSASTFTLNAGAINFETSPSSTSSTSTSNVANLASGSSTGSAATAEGIEAEDAMIQVNVSFTPAAEGAIGWLDYLLMEQECFLKMSEGWLDFQSVSNQGFVSEYHVTSNDASVEVWDVTLPSQPIQMELESSDVGINWKSFADTTRRFIVFTPQTFPSPTFHALVEPSNLHGVVQADLVIITRPAYMEAAQRLAAIHADEGLQVLLTTQRAVFDEFSSGSVDPTAIKMLMMMLWDRAIDSGGAPPKYLQLFGDGTFANRLNLEASPYVITYQSENSVSPTGSYVSDDYFGFLEDQYGEGIGDKLAIGVGRIPCSSLTEANAAVDKIEAYLQHPSSSPLPSGCLDESNGDNGTWRNRICFVSDDMDGNGGPTEIEHMVNSDEHAQTLAENHPAYDVTKIYLDAYPQESTPGGERYPEAQAEIDRQVQDGALIVNYIGHGGERGWSHERILNTTTIQEWDNLERMPLFMTATCELARFDDPDVDSAGEMMVLNPKGGAIAMLTTTRVVFSGSNQQLNRAFYDIALQDTGAVPLRLGDIARVTKNDPQVSNSSNKRNFSLLGDVALRLNYPENQVVFTEVPDTLNALETATIKGIVTDDFGNIIQDFNGIVHAQVFDKRSQITTLNNDDAPNPHTFEVFRNVLFRGVASVVEGEFEFEFIVPRDIDYSFGAGRISAYAVSDSTDAHGSTQSLVIGGVAEGFEIDDTPPYVRLFLNDTTFQSGGLTDENPWLLARVFDEGGINASGVGIGHDIKATLDNQSDESIVLNAFYTTDLNTYQSGTVRYPFENLEEGRHQLDLVVWDVQNNKGSASVDFIVASSLEAAFGQVIAYPNPSAEGFQFSIEHNQACQEGRMILEIFSSRGALVHRQESQWHEDGFRSQSMAWDPSSNGGSEQVSAGVYLFRMTLIPDLGTPVQYSDQLVVLRP
ncbi:MAG: type IX secretion system sortase PorU [Bacteroidetes bacterium]|nr:type IX secretion system sortase PorU [Bacteroidota bacterium]